MPHIAIISASVRTGRTSHRVALFFQQFIKNNNLGTAEMLDLQQYNFPVFEERLQYQENPAAQTLDFAEKIRRADGVLIVTPEYNGGYPASLKNVIDLLYEEWHRKPVAIATVSDGVFGGTQVIMSLQFSLWKIRAWVVPARFPVPEAQTNYDEHGTPTDRATTEKRARHFIEELLWCIEARSRMEAKPQL
ncbi:NAD(P)H-dependent oxidoreductase [Pontibacter sp. Tf4]|uniref:NADPH-dependent FMN reductase n=1 Tax=Pontibacter sp. Tf4 TaxID=2761620 RepID=UPI00162A4432|nr:NAD(P)H-dependent oxidoreductase [Pontibacter sp. Tf4]MBB6612707.1 NAD(P)H-dependent oxidoreductase [Pontibacter sp. Tf4]